MLAEVFYGPFTTLWHFWILSFSFPFWSFIILPTLPLHTNQFNFTEEIYTPEGSYISGLLSSEINWCVMEFLQNAFYFVNIGLQTFIQGGIFASYFGISFLLSFLLFFSSIEFYKLTSAFDSFALKTPKFSTLPTTFLIKCKIY